MDIRAELRPEGCILLAALCLTLPLNWLLAAAAAACVHELCHFLAVRLLGGRIRRLTMGFGGAVLDGMPMTPGRQLAAILAGPCGSLLLLLLRRAQPMVAICGLVQGIFNLLPVMPLDGGRALECVCCRLLSEQLARRVCDSVFYLTVCLLLLAGLWGCWLGNLGFSSLFAAGFLVFSLIKLKISCKEVPWGVQ